MGFVCEIVFSAIGMNAPGFASAGDDVEDAHPGLRIRRVLGRRGVAEHERGGDSDTEGSRERARVEEEAGTERPVAEYEREDREGQRRR